MDNYRKLCEWLIDHGACREGATWSQDECRSLPHMWYMLADRADETPFDEWLLWVWDELYTHGSSRDPADPQWLVLQQQSITLARHAIEYPFFEKYFKEDPIYVKAAELFSEPDLLSKESAAKLDAFREELQAHPTTGCSVQEISTAISLHRVVIEMCDVHAAGPGGLFSSYLLSTKMHSLVASVTDVWKHARAATYLAKCMAKFPNPFLEE